LDIEGPVGLTRAADYALHSVFDRLIVEAIRRLALRPYPNPSVALIANSFTELLPRNICRWEYALCKQATDYSLLRSPRGNAASTGSAVPLIQGLWQNGIEFQS